VGICVWLTGLSGAGKSATVAAMVRQLAELGHSVTFVDGDVLRRSISADLGFSPTDRDRNVLRAATLARTAVEQGEIVLCALISPYAAARARARQIVGDAYFVEVFVDTPLAVCEARDPKGLYALARRGLLREFTGIDAPYEPPQAPALIVRGVGDIDENARHIVELIVRRLETEPSESRGADRRERAHESWQELDAPAS
jgi:adenylyl-sulfate kinase